MSIGLPKGEQRPDVEVVPGGVLALEVEKGRKRNPENETSDGVLSLLFV